MLKNPLMHVRNRKKPESWSAAQLTREEGRSACLNAEGGRLDLHAVRRWVRYVPDQRSCHYGFPDLISAVALAAMYAIDLGQDPRTDAAMSRL